MKKVLILMATFLMLQIFMVVFYMFAYIPPLVFVWFICVLYLVAMPKYLFSPQNIVFAYYFIWYGLSPAFALRFQDYTFTTNEEKLAYLMLFFTFGVSMVFLTFCESYFETRKDIEELKREYIEPRKVKRIIGVSISITLVSLIIFINKTGGVNRWITDSAMAYISRHGTGLIYLSFLHSLMIFASACGVFLYKNKRKISSAMFFLLVIVMFPFIGSKAQVILIVFIGMGLFLINKELISKWTIRTITTVAILFSIGIYQRNYEWMKLSDFAPYALNYFNTYEMFVILIRDFEPSFLKTIVLPFNRLLMEFGIYIHVPFHDMSIWLSSIYYPNDYKVGATQQWPLEADLYMSFYYILGIPFLLMYLAWISYAFYKARQRYVAWILIYMVEFVYILSHYRGGLIMFWYFWLIPFYMLVIFIFRRMKVSI